MATTKIKPKAVLDIANDTYKKLESARIASNDLYKKIKHSATGNKGQSYWKGNRAFNWYCTALRNCANSYYRLYKVAKTYKIMCDDAQKVIMADSVMKSSEKVTYDGLAAKKIRFGDIMNKCETAYNQVLTWGQS